MKLKSNKLKLKLKTLRTNSIDLSKFKIKEKKYNWMSFEKDNKFGLINKKTKLIINPIYDSCFISKDVVLVIKNTKEGWINEKGELYLSTFDIMYSFTDDGIAIFEKDGFYGFVDIYGNIIGENFDFCNNFDKGIGICKKEEYSYLINTKGKIIFKRKNIRIFELNNGIFRFFNEKTKKYGFIDVSGKVILNNMDKLKFIQEGLAVFKKNGKYGWVDKNGKIFAEGFDICKDFKNGLGIFRKDNKYGVINKKGTIIRSDLETCNNFHNGFAAFRRKGKWGWMDKTGKIFIEGFDYCYDFGKKVGLYEYNKKKHLINKKGIVIIKDFDAIVMENKELFTVYKNKEYFLMDINGNILNKESLDFIDYIYKEFFKIKQKGYFGVMNTSGEILGKGFDSCSNVNSKGYFSVVLNKEKKWMDKNGKIYDVKPY